MADNTNETTNETKHTGLITGYDLHLLGQGKHWQSYEKLGAHLCTLDGVDGVNFAVWAPNATSVRVVGDFNGWNPEANFLWKFQDNGIWETFIPNATEGMLYKYVIEFDGELHEKCDPYAFASECPPKTACRIVDLNRFQWQDSDWLEQRGHFDWQHKPISVYEVHLGSWKRGETNPESGLPWMNYREIADQLVDYVKALNFTHIELLPVCEHPLTESWGYQIIEYYAPTARYGSPEDFMYLVDKFHQNGIGVLLDWVPAHFVKDAKGLGRFDGTALYEYEDPRLGEHAGWGTYVCNYRRNEVQNFLISNALYWVEKFHIDGLRVDAVASMLYLDYDRQEGAWVPNQFGGHENIEAANFLREMNKQVQNQHPGVITIAEESTAWPGVTQPGYVGGLGFCLKWNMGWMHDILSYMGDDPLYRKYHHDRLTFGIMYAFSENFMLPFSHDEIVHGKASILGRMPGDLWRKFANVRLLYSFQWTYPGKKLVFMGDEFGQWKEWNCDGELQWELLQYQTHQGVQKCVADLCQLYRTEPALYELDFDTNGFEWIDCSNRDVSTITYIRRAKNSDEYVIVACNFTPEVRHDFWIGVPEPVEYHEIFNSDASAYGGSDVRNTPVQAVPEPCQNQNCHIRITLPPLGVVVLKKANG